MSGDRDTQQGGRSREHALGGLLCPQRATPANDLGPWCPQPPLNYQIEYEKSEEPGLGSHQCHLLCSLPGQVSSQLRAHFSASSNGI